MTYKALHLAETDRQTDRQADRQKGQTGHADRKHLLDEHGTHDPDDCEGHNNDIAYEKEAEPTADVIHPRWSVMHSEAFGSVWPFSKNFGTF